MFKFCFQIHLSEVIHDCRKLGVQRLKLKMMDNKLTYSSVKKERKKNEIENEVKEESKHDGERENKRS